MERVVLEFEGWVLEKIQVGNQIGRNQREAREEQAGINRGHKPDGPRRFAGDDDSAHVLLRFRVELRNDRPAVGAKGPYGQSVAGMGRARLGA